MHTYVTYDMLSPAFLNVPGVLVLWHFLLCLQVNVLLDRLVCVSSSWMFGECMYRFPVLKGLNTGHWGRSHNGGAFQLCIYLNVSPETKACEMILSSAV